MKVHMARSETKLGDRNENKHKVSNRAQSYTHFAVVPRETGKKTQSCSREKINQKRPSKNGTGTKIGRWKEEGYGRRREDGEVDGERKGRDRPGSTR